MKKGATMWYASFARKGKFCRQHLSGMKGHSPRGFQSPYTGLPDYFVDLQEHLMTQDTSSERSGSDSLQLCLSLSALLAFHYGSNSFELIENGLVAS